jgi:hypothetical protein
MTNYYSSGGALFPVANKKHKKIVIEVLEILDWAEEQDFYEEILGGGLLNEFDKRAILSKTNGNEDIADCIIAVLQSEDYYQQLSYIEENNSIFIYNEENLSADGLANLVQGLLAMFGYDNIVNISWAETHSRQVPFDYGGGAIAVSRLGIVWLLTDFWLNVTARNLFESAGLEQNSYYTSNLCPVCEFEEDYFIKDSHTEKRFHYSTVTCNRCESEWVNIYAPISRQIISRGKVHNDKDNEGGMEPGQS